MPHISPLARSQGDCQDIWIEAGPVAYIEYHLHKMFRLPLIIDVCLYRWDMNFEMVRLTENDNITEEEGVYSYQFQVNECKVRMESWEQLELILQMQQDMIRRKDEQIHALLTHLRDESETYVVTTSME